MRQQGHNLSMIHILCLNPTIDRMYFIDDFLPGNQFHGNTPSVFPGGKGMNILRVLSSLIHPLSFYAFTAGENGEIIKKEAERLGAISTFIEVEGDTRTTINIIDKKNNRETEIKEKGPFITSENTNLLLSHLTANIKEKDIIILSGSLPDGIDKDIYLQISRIAEKKGADVLLDSGGNTLKSSLGGKYLLIKPNENEIRTLFDDFSSSLSSLAEKLHKKGAENVLITKGGEGAYFFSRNKEYEIKVPKVEVVSTIGSGDSTLAGFTYALSLSLPLIDTLMSALAFGTNNAMHREVGKVEIKEVEEIRKKIEIKEVNNYDL